MGSPDGSMSRLLPENTMLGDPTLAALLGSWLRPETIAWAQPALTEMGRAAGDELQAWGELCERQPAALRSFDGWGNRVDEVAYPDAWRQLAAVAARTGLVALPYEAEMVAHLGADARLVQAALCYLFAPSTATYLCPVAMTDGAARVLAGAAGAGQSHEVLGHPISR